MCRHFRPQAVAKNSRGCVKGNFVRLTSDKKGAISFTAGMKTPQKATVTVENGDTLVMRGVNGDSQGIKGALKFEARVKVLTDGGFVSALGQPADFVVGLIAVGCGHFMPQDSDSDGFLFSAGAAMMVEQ